MIQILSCIIISPVVCRQGSCTIPVPFLSVVRWLCSNIFSIFIKPASVSPDVKFGNDENFAIHSSTWQSGATDAKGKWCVSIWLAIWNTRENIIVLFQVWRLFSGWKSVYDTAVYMIDTNICKMFPEMFDPAGAIIAYLWLAIWWIGYLREIISRHKEGTYHGFWLYSDRLFNVKSLLRMSQPIL